VRFSFPFDEAQTADSVGEMISQPNLPETLIPRCMDVLSKIANGERDLIRVIVEVITELREDEEDEDNDGVSSPDLFILRN
jgi:hypothetical protein